MKTPRTPKQWQEAVDAAKALLVLDSARQYGLVAGGPKVNVERCQELLAAGEQRDVTPGTDCVERMVAELTAEG